MRIATVRDVDRIGDGTIVEVTRGFVKGRRGKIGNAKWSAKTQRWTYEVELEPGVTLHVDGEFVAPCTDVK